MPTNSAWRLRDTQAAFLLFFATAGFTLWQNSRVAVLWDLSFLLDSAYRFSLGQVPYRDLPFAYAPLTFLLHAGIIHIFGRVYLPHMLCAPVEAGLATLLTWRILVHLSISTTNPAASDGSPLPWRLTTLLAVPLTVLSIYGVYPHPIYDGDAVLITLLALFLLQRASANRAMNLMAGGCCALPEFFKQNIGFAFLVSTLGAVAIMAFSGFRRRISIAPQLWILVGAAGVLTFGGFLIHSLAGLHNYVYWTISFARQRRLPGLSTMLSPYRQTALLWALPGAIAGIALTRRAQRWLRNVGTLLLGAPFLWTVASLARSVDSSDRADHFLALWPYLLLLGLGLALSNLRLSRLSPCPTLGTLLPAILLATIHGTFLSQQLWGSTYALWPMLVLLLGCLLMQVKSVAGPLGILTSVALVLCGGLYAVSLERLTYIHLDGGVAYATLPELRGMAAPGPWIPAFEELVRFTKAEIPAGDGIVLLPGEDPFYFATGRIPRFPVLLFDPATDPYTPAQTRDAARTYAIRWLIVNRQTQLAGTPHPELPQVLEAMQQDFVPYRILSNYTIYRRR